MPVDKIENLNQTISNSKVQSKSQERQKTVEKPDKTLSNSAKFMIGATALAATIAIGVIGHKNNWWRKAVQEGQNLAENAQAAPQNPAVTEEIQVTREVVADTKERLIQRVNSTLSKELKHVKRSLKQYNEFMDAFLETRRSFNGDYIKYLESKGYITRTVERDIFVYDKDNQLVQVLRNCLEENRLVKSSYIDFYGKDGKIKKTVSFVNNDNIPMMFFYDKKGQVTKRITNICAVGGAQKPQIFVSYLTNGKVTKEAIYIQPLKEGLDGDYSTSQVLNMAKYGKKKIFEAGKMSVGESPRYVLIGGEPYFIHSDNSLEKADIGNLSLNERRAYTFNSDNQIITRMDAISGNIYKACDSKTGACLYYLHDKDGIIEQYNKYNQENPNHLARRIIYELGDEPECYTSMFYENGQRINDATLVIPKKDFDAQSFYAPFKADYAPDKIIEPNKF